MEALARRGASLAAGMQGGGGTGRPLPPPPGVSPEFGALLEAAAAGEALAPEQQARVVAGLVARIRGEAARVQARAYGAALSAAEARAGVAAPAMARLLAAGGGAADADADAPRALAVALVEGGPGLWEAWRERLRDALAGWARQREAGARQGSGQGRPPAAEQQQQQQQGQATMPAGAGGARAPDPTAVKLTVNARTPDERPLRYELFLRWVPSPRAPVAFGAACLLARAGALRSSAGHPARALPPRARSAACPLHSPPANKMQPWRSRRAPRPRQRPVPPGAGALPALRPGGRGHARRAVGAGRGARPPAGWPAREGGAGAAGPPVAHGGARGRRGPLAGRALAGG